MKALILNNKVVDVVEVEFETHESMTWLDCAAECKVGWTLDGTILIAPPEPEPLTYDKLRAEAYPSTVDQLDDIYHNGVDGWKATIKAVKDTYPKETI